MLGKSPWPFRILSSYWLNGSQICSSIPQNVLLLVDSVLWCRFFCLTLLLLALHLVLYWRRSCHIWGRETFPFIIQRVLQFWFPSFRLWSIILNILIFLNTEELLHIYFELPVSVYLASVVFSRTPNTTRFYGKIETEKKYNDWLLKEGNKVIYIFALSEFKALVSQACYIFWKSNTVSVRRTGRPGKKRKGQTDQRLCKSWPTKVLHGIIQGPSL